MDFAAATDRAAQLWKTFPAIRYAFADLGALAQTQLSIGAEIDEYAAEWRNELVRRCVAGAERLALVRDPAFARAQSNPIERNASALVVWLYGPVTSNAKAGGCSAQSIARAIAEASTAKALVFRISSHGGSVEALKLIRNAVANFKGRTIAIVDHFAISAAADIACGCDRVVMRQNAVLKLHRSSVAVSGHCEDLTNEANALRSDDAFLARYLACKRRIALDTLSELIRADRYLSADQAKELGLCDAITRPLDGSDTVIAYEGFTDAR